MARLNVVSARRTRDSGRACHGRPGGGRGGPGVKASGSFKRRFLRPSSAKFFFNSGSLVIASPNRFNCVDRLGLAILGAATLLVEREVLGGEVVAGPGLDGGDRTQPDRGHDQRRDRGRHRRPVPLRPSAYPVGPGFCDKGGDGLVGEGASRSRRCKSRDRRIAVGRFSRHRLQTYCFQRLVDLRPHLTRRREVAGLYLRDELTEVSSLARERGAWPVMRQ